MKKDFLTGGNGGNRGGKTEAFLRYLCYLLFNSGRIPWCHSCLGGKNCLHSGHEKPIKRSVMFDPLAFSRRGFLERSALGFGSLALAHLLGQEGRASEADGSGDEAGPGRKRSVAAGRALSGAGPVGHSAHAKRRAEPGRPVRSQARAAKAQRPAASAEGRKLSAGEPGQSAHGLGLPLPQARRVRHGAVRALAAHRLGGRRHLPRPLDGGGQQQPPAGAALHQHGENLPRPADIRRLGELRAWARSTRTCRRTSCSAIPTATTTAARRSGKTAGCRPFSAEPRSSRAARPSSTCTPQRRCRAEVERNNLALLADLNEERRKLYPADTGAGGPHQELRAGRPHAAPRRAAARPLARNARPRGGCTASTTRRRPTSARAA